ncbi:CCA tRNA nucleotidyltransferase [Exserohilum turcicum]
MSRKSSPPQAQEPSPKRRKIGTPSPQFIQPYGTMSTSEGAKSAQLELTEVESKLRQLLLDVAAYIDEHPSNGDVTGVQVPAELAKEKVTLRWTGGWVRDKLLKVGSNDIDVAINKMTGEHFGLKMQEYLEMPGNAEKHGLVDKSSKRSGADKTKKIAPGLHKIEANPEKSKNLETATTKIMGIDLDLVNLRKETYNEVSRNPQMEFGTPEEDAMRRDATVNAMFYNLHTCQVEDFTGRGHDDMAAKIIRTPLEPYQTFKDDPLRVLRLIRFASRLDYTIEPETAKAMGNPEIQDVLKVKISRERVGTELEKMLRGPRPRMALELINRFGLYQTIFTDPTRELPAGPETEYFKPAYELIESVDTKSGDVPAVIPATLLKNEEDEYLAWICATTMPWADAPKVPHSKPSQRPLFAAYLVAREGFKAPNKICDVVASSLSNSEKIRNLVAQCAKGLRRPDTINPTSDATARDTLGMAIRQWGSTWRTQVLFNLCYEIVLGRVSRDDTFRSYASFLGRVTELGLLEADTFKPLVKGTDLAKALNTQPGPWMKDALDVVMAWQLRNPDTMDTKGAIEAVAASRSEQNESELPLRLASHFLQLTMPPLFAQNKPTSNALEASRQPAPWKEAGNQYALDLLAWAMRRLDKKNIEAQWQFLMPPILRMMDDIHVEWKAKGCHMLNLVLEGLRPPASSGSVSASFVQRSGYDKILAEALLPMFTYLPSITPEEECVTLLREVYPAVISLALLLPEASSKGDNREAFLDGIVRQGIVSPLGHFTTPSAYAELATLIMSYVPVTLGHLGISTVKHVGDILPLLAAVLQEPFALSHAPLLGSTLKALQSVVLNAWPRVAGHRGVAMMGLCLLWSMCLEEEDNEEDEEAGREQAGQIKAAVQETVGMLDAAMQSAEQADVVETWRREKQDLVARQPGFGDMFGECVEQAEV